VGSIVDRVYYPGLRAAKRGVRVALLIAAMLAVMSLARQTSQMARTPYETKTGPILYHYVIFSLLQYGRGDDYLRAEFGCRSGQEIGEAVAWADRIVQRREGQPEWQVPATLVSALAHTALHHSEQASEHFHRAMEIVESRGQLDLVRGARVHRQHLKALVARWKSTPPFSVCGQL
jgi:hypothetical protein